MSALAAAHEWKAAGEDRAFAIERVPGALPLLAVLFDGRLVVAYGRGLTEGDALAQALTAAMLEEQAPLTAFDATRECCVALVRGACLQIDEVTCGSGVLIDWRTLRNGETLLEADCSFDLAYLFVALVGPLRAAHEARTHVVQMMKGAIEWIV